MSKISGQFLISGQFQDICEISGISGQLGALRPIFRQSHSEIILLLVLWFSSRLPCRLFFRQL